jgi:hypothetical protein
MTRRTGLLVLLLLAVAWLAYQTWPPHWQARAAERAAIDRCKDIKHGEHLSLAEIEQRNQRCRAMEAAFRAKW